MKKKNNPQIDLAKNTVRLHGLYVLAYAISVIIFDSWNLITPDSIKQRWTVVAIALVTVSVVAYLVKYRSNSTTVVKLSIFALIIADLVLAATTVYGERGMASPAVMLFSVPIVVSVALMNRGLIYLTASLATAVYASTVVRYFVNFGSEGYKVQLYGTLFLYIAVFYLLAALLATTSRSK